MYKATDTHSDEVILTAFPLQQRLHERASMLRYTYIHTYIACLVNLLVPLCATANETMPISEVGFVNGTPIESCPQQWYSGNLQVLFC